MKVIGIVLAYFAIAFAVACVASACVMMGVHYMHDWWSFIPTMGFWQAFWITVWFAIPLSLYTSNASRD